MHGRRIGNPKDFDPFEFNHVYRPFRNRSSSTLAILFGLIVAGLMAVVTVEGTLGSLSDLQLLADLKRIIGVSGVPASDPYFPFVRDVASWLLLFTIVFGGVALHQQWRLMATCLTELTESGALIAKRDRTHLLAGKGLGTRLLGLNRIIETCPPDQALGALVDRVMGPMRRIGVLWSLSIGVASFILSTLLILGEKHALFSTFAPRDLDGAQRAAWLEQAYAGWWASDSNTYGYIAYGILAFIAIYIILSFNSVGVIAVYLVVSLRYVAQPGADWLNRDGRYGWTPIAKVYRTVLLGVALLSLALTVTLAVLGLENYQWISVLLVIYTVVVPMFTIVPRLVFRRVEQIARDERIGDIVAGIEAKQLRLDRDFERLAPYLAEIDRCRQAKIHPFRLRKVSFSTLTFLYVLPIVIGIAQIVFPLRLGS